MSNIRSAHLVKNEAIPFQSPRFQNFGTSRISLNPTQIFLPNSDDSLCQVIDSCKIFGSTEVVRLNENITDLGWF